MQDEAAPDTQGESLEKEFDINDQTFSGDSGEGQTERKNPYELTESPTVTPRGVYGTLKGKKHKKKRTPKENNFMKNLRLLHHGHAFGYIGQPLYDIPKPTELARSPRT